VGNDIIAVYEAGQDIHPRAAFQHAERECGGLGVRGGGMHGWIPLRLC
jgi:hypothetical protein